MSVIKDYMSKIETQGFQDSDMFVCAGCIGDKYISTLIKNSHKKGKCSFCNKTRNIVSLNEVLSIIVDTIRRYYLPADGNAIWDDECKWFLDSGVCDHYDFVHYTLSSYLQIDNEELINEIQEKLNDDLRIPKSSIIQTLEDELVTQWKRYCESIKKLENMRSDAIISMIRDDCRFNDSNNNINFELSMIADTLETVVIFCQELKLIKFFPYSKDRGCIPEIYRAVNYISKKNNSFELTRIDASEIGTPPAEKAKDNRMSEANEMVFYGASDIETAKKEIGKKDKNPFTVGHFITNKRLKILDLSEISDNMIPSIFEPDSEEKRNCFGFLREFTYLISEEKKEYDAHFYKPTQVFTKYVKTVLGVQGIKYRSSKGNGYCYALFVNNSDCINSYDLINKNRNQLIMTKIEQVD